MKKLIILSAVALATAGSAQTSGSSDSSSQNNSPNETICRVIAETGSRLARSRVCMTRAEWEQQRREMRESTERGQNRQINPQPSG